MFSWIRKAWDDASFFHAGNSAGAPSGRSIARYPFCTVKDILSGRVELSLSCTETVALENMPIAPPFPMSRALVPRESPCMGVPESSLGSSKVFFEALALRKSPRKLFEGKRNEYPVTQTIEKNVRKRSPRRKE